MERIDPPRTLALRFAALAFCVVAAAAGARASEKETVLRACGREFGAAVDAKQNLFEVNDSFVLQPKFDARGALDMMSVTPKYYFEETHPEWTEPHHWPLLSRSEFAAVLARVDSVRPRGRWAWSSGDSSAVTNSTHYFTDEYEHAFVERGDYADIGVRFVHIYFMHGVAGVVARKYRCGRGFEDDFREGLHHVTAGGCGYFVGRTTFARLRVGRRSRFRAAGPMGARCGVRPECARLGAN
jgi:hypothetical protein